MSDYIRLAPARPSQAFTDDEALDAAKAAFTDAKLAYGETQSEFGYLTTRLAIEATEPRGSATTPHTPRPAPIPLGAGRGHQS